MNTRKLFRSKRVLLEDGLQEAGILVGVEGKIEEILRKSELGTLHHNVEILDVGNLVIMPGLVDSHVHVNEPGRTEWEGYWTATRAAAAGGVTTIIDMPLNSIPPTTTKKNLDTKMMAAKGKTHVDVAFWGGVIPGNQKELKELASAGVVGFKCFLCPSGVDEFPEVTKQDVEASLRELEGTDSVLAILSWHVWGAEENLTQTTDITLLKHKSEVLPLQPPCLVQFRFNFHAECDLGEELIKDTDNPCEYQTFLRSRPPQMEVAAIKLITQLCSNYRVRCHIVHLSAAEALPFVRTAKKNGTMITAETCHHYLTLNAEAIPDSATEYKCCPPVRGLQNRERLWAALASGDLDMVVSDHSPCVPEMKQMGDGEGNFLSAWGGISSLQFGLSLFWTEAKKRGFSIADVSYFLSHNPSKLCRLQDTKGQLKEGMDADLVIWDPEAKLQLTPYLGKQLDGRVMYTILRGHIVYQNGKFSPPLGQLVLPSSLQK